jgi:transcriptional antiterminator RfaH
MTELQVASCVLQAESGAQWYCLKAQVLREHLAAGMLSDYAEGVSEVFMPRIRYQRKTRTGKKWFQEALFPGYFFARFDYSSSAYQVRSAPGILKIVAFGNYAPPIPDAAIEQLADQVPSEGVVEVVNDFHEGDEVRITEGPFAGLTSVLRRVMPGKERVQVLLEFLGNPVLAEVGLDALEHPDPLRLKGREFAIAR